MDSETTEHLHTKAEAPGNKPEQDTLAEWNALDPKAAAEALLACCGSERWAHTLAARRPFHDRETLAHAANNLWFLLDEKDWLEAFARHPRIGEQQAGEGTGLAFQASSASEQQTARASLNGIGETLAARNAEYESRFGFLYIVFANGRTAPELLAVLEGRMRRDRFTELHEASREQQRITRLRMDRWLGGYESK